MDAATATRLDQPSLTGCAKVDVALENGTVVEEGDMEEQEQELELGGLEEVDQQSVVLSLIQRYPKFCYKDTHCLHKSSPVSSTPSLLVTCISSNIASTGSSCVSVLHVCEKKKCI
ncbi:uncharacterized protein LOC130760547 [Actinidia eriantha]|uniref:uncharacterized protein LOC130760547 n=1 Tax=Actinidia eriantha TaxID=165200 RepID=UPI002588A6DE|nr:uncharacterized protein LOC130760547 [Actinidia eriantha]